LRCRAAGIGVVGRDHVVAGDHVGEQIGVVEAQPVSSTATTMLALRPGTSQACSALIAAGAVFERFRRPAA
jgi:hypothetical protein